MEAKSDVDVYGLFERLGEKVPVLSAVRPNGPDTIEAFEAAGGARAIMKQLEPMLDTERADGVGAHGEGEFARRESRR